VSDLGTTKQQNEKLGQTGLGRIVGVDVGGTFTDLFYFDEASAKFRTNKVPSNRGDEAVGFLDGLRGFGAIADLSSIVHGTTVGTNALLERKGARVGLITTEGFTILVLVALVTSAMAGPLIRRYMRQLPETPDEDRRERLAD